MAKYYRLPCPKCRQRLRIRDQYVGLLVACKHCEADFVFDPEREGVELDGVANGTTAAPGGTSDKEVIQRLEREVEGLRLELDAALIAATSAAEERTQLRVLRAERDRLAADHNRSRLAWESERKGLAGQVALATDGAALARAEVERLTVELSAAREALAKLVPELESLRAEHAEAVARHEARCAEYRAAVEANDAERARLQHEHDAQAARAETLSREVEGTRSEMDKLRDEMSTWGLAIRQRDKSLAALAATQERVKALETSVAEQLGELKDSRAARQDAEAKLAAAERKVEELTTLVGHAENFKNQMTTVLGGLGIRFPG
jgi:chromosome segregation ATPase